jgi:hypothetical protein
MLSSMIFFAGSEITVVELNVSFFTLTLIITLITFNCVAERIIYVKELIMIKPKQVYL